MIQIHIASLVIGFLLGFFVASAVLVFADKAVFYDDRYWAGWGEGWNKGYKAHKEIENTDYIANPVDRR